MSTEQKNKTSSGKPEPSLVVCDMAEAVLEVSKVMAIGRDKYYRMGYLDVENPEEVYTDAMLRHIIQESIEDLDESGLLHASHVAANALIRLQVILRDRNAG